MKSSDTPHNAQMQEDWFTFKMIEEACRNSMYLDTTIFDDLVDEATPKSFYLKNLLVSVEKLALHWNLINKEDFAYRTKNYAEIEKFINEIPRVSNGRYFNIKTFILS